MRDVLGDTLGNSLGSEFLFRKRAIEVAADSTITSGDVIVVKQPFRFVLPKILSTKFRVAPSKLTFIGMLLFVEREGQICKSNFQNSINFAPLC